MAVLERVPHHEEREEQKQFQHLETGEFTVMPFLNSNAGEIEVQAGDCTDYTINGPVTEIICLSLTIAFSIESFLIALKDTHFLRNTELKAILFYLRNLNNIKNE